mmetsp:Transcript_27856/g.72308  ORF Transcript_27856/g.72308 Transcript_27856/m.72308 type:complete len:223 (+) Transcript_27856:295-963(+)
MERLRAPVASRGSTVSGDIPALETVATRHSSPPAREAGRRGSATRGWTEFSSAPPTAFPGGEPPSSRPQQLRARLDGNRSRRLTPLTGRCIRRGSPSAVRRAQGLGQLGGRGPSTRTAVRRRNDAATMTERFLRRCAAPWPRCGSPTSESAARPSCSPARHCWPTPIATTTKTRATCRRGGRAARGLRPRTIAPTPQRSARRRTVSTRLRQQLLPLAARLFG